MLLPVLIVIKQHSLKVHSGQKNELAITTLAV